jgi:signal transduction histidine kinase
MSELESSHQQRLVAAGILFASVAHELKNVLMSVSGDAQLGAMAKSLDEAKERLANIRSHANRANDILVNMLKFSSENDEQTLVSANELIDSVRHMLESHLRILDVKLIAGSPVPTSIQVKGSLNQLQQVLVNLIFNAADAVQDSSQKKVTLHVSLGAQLRIIVQDSGPGIKDGSRIFEAFATTKKNGTGLGLFISKQIAEAHGGTLSLENPGDVGARFALVLQRSDS